MIKYFEIRDRATFIPAIAVNLIPDNAQAGYLMRRCGYDPTRPAIMLTRLAGETTASADFYHWRDRTMRVAHEYIYNHWDELTSGDVVDVEFALGEAPEPKVTERFTYPA